MKPIKCSPVDGKQGWFRCDSEGLTALHQGLARLADATDLHHSLGLLQVRLKNTEEALKSLQRAVKLAPN